MLVSSSRRVWTLALVGLLCWSVISTASSLYFFQQYSSVRASLVKVSVTIDYGNGTAIVYDEVYLFKDATVLDAIRAVATVNATYWETHDAFFVDAINGVWNNEGGNNRWWEYSVNGKIGPVSADKYILRDGDRVEWRYIEFS